MKFKHQIYPAELGLTSDNKDDQQVNYLDLHIQINDEVLYYELYDKRDKFTFTIVNFPNLSGNIPTSESYNVFYSQLIRYARGCQRLYDFRTRTLKLVGKLLLQHFKLSRLKRTYEKFLQRQINLIRKFQGFVYKWDIL